VFDIRLPAAESEILHLPDFSSTILATAIAFEKTRIVVGAADGDFRKKLYKEFYSYNHFSGVWEPRMYHVSLIKEY
jgi:hypothetical protein